MRTSRQRRPTGGHTPSTVRALAEASGPRRLGRYERRLPEVRRYHPHQRRRAAAEDYSPHHNAFAYYKSTANPHHLARKSIAEVGHSGRANHNYDLTDFDTSLKAGSLPAVSFLKAGEYQDGHAGYSDPTDEQHFLVKEINALQRSPEWKSTAVVVACDDSDGWYDHVTSKILNGSKDSTVDSNGKALDSTACQSGPDAKGGYADHCGPGTRQPPPATR